MSRYYHYFKISAKDYKDMWYCFLLIVVRYKYYSLKIVDSSKLNDGTEVVQHFRYEGLLVSVVSRKYNCGQYNRLAERKTLPPHTSTSSCFFLEDYHQNSSDKKMTAHHCLHVGPVWSNAGQVILNIPAIFKSSFHITG